jgi:hypothetical protein
VSLVEPPTIETTATAETVAPSAQQLLAVEVAAPKAELPTWPYRLGSPREDSSGGWEECKYSPPSGYRRPHVEINPLPEVTASPLRCGSKLSATTVDLCAAVLKARLGDATVPDWVAYFAAKLVAKQRAKFATVCKTLVHVGSFLGVTEEHSLSACAQRNLLVPLAKAPRLAPRPVHATALTAMGRPTRMDLKHRSLLRFHVDSADLEATLKQFDFLQNVVVRPCPQREQRYIRRGEVMQEVHDLPYG